MEESSTCVLCEKRAVMLCDSDQAKLCWDCDEKVHSANFLVAKHSRVLLCRLCHSPTPWKASGTKLTPTLSFCHRCVANRNVRWNRLVNTEHQQQSVLVEDDGREHGSDHVFDDDDYSDEEDEDEEEEDEERQDENQVVPMSSGSVTSSPKGLRFERLRNNSFSIDSSHDETRCSSDMLSFTLFSDNESTSLDSVLKKHRVYQQNHRPLVEH